MTPVLLWAILLLALAIGIIFLEMFIPSGGLLGFVSAAIAVSAVALVFWQEGLVRGVIFLVFASFILPLAVAAAIKVWPHTAIGRKVLNLPPGEEAAIAAAPNYSALQQLLGQRGVSKTKMLPSGSISLGGGKTFDAVSQSGPIMAGQPIEVVKVDGTRILVREISSEEVLPADEETREIEDPFAT